jgi:hypothetical protein
MRGAVFVARVAIAFLFNFNPAAFLATLRRRICSPTSASAFMTDFFT